MRHRDHIVQGPRNVFETMLVFVLEVRLHLGGEVSGIQLAQSPAPVNLLSVLDTGPF